MKSIIIVLSLIAILIGLGCATLSSYVTPADIDKKSVEYVVDANIATFSDYAGYPNLLKAERLQKDVDAAHSVIQLDLQQLAEKDSLTYGIYKDVTVANFKAALEREEVLFGEQGLLSLGLSMAGMGTLTGFLGLMRKRPGDVTSADMEKALAEATGKTTEELSAKQKQFIEVVKGVQRFADTYKQKTEQSSNPSVFVVDMLAEMKNIFNASQDSTTQVAVAEVKKS